MKSHKISEIAPLALIYWFTGHRSHSSTKVSFYHLLGFQHFRYELSVRKFLSVKDKINIFSWMQRSLPRIIITTYSAAHKNMGVNQDEHNNYNGWFVLLRILEDS